jgi:hypothetical protein
MAAAAAIKLQCFVVVNKEMMREMVVCEQQMSLVFKQ